MYKIFVLIYFLSMAVPVFSQEKADNVKQDTTDLANMSLEQLSRLKSRYAATDMEKSINQAIEAASRKPLSMRRSPSIVSVITDEEIEKSGANDLMGILKMIPGVEFNVDVQGVVAISFRGMWANEGNILMQIDGQEINETAIAGLMFGNHYPVCHIKKIEFIRGPGSAIYGGYAEYAVINIILKNGSDLKGINVDGVGGQMSSTYSRQDVGVSMGNKVNDFTYAVSGFIGRGQRSDFDYSDINHSTFSMKNNSNLNPHFFNANLSYKHLSLVCIYDNYQCTTRDGYISALSRPYPCNFLSYMAELKYTTQLGKKTTFISQVSYKHSVPWTFNGQPLPIDSSYGYYKILADRYRFNFMVNYDPVSWLKTTAGIEGFFDDAYKPNGQVFEASNTDRVNYFNYAPFVQLLLKSALANVTVGARYDVSTSFGSAFNPRLGITKRLGAFNFKLLYASSFRAPSIEDIQYAINGVKLKPEESNTLEFETSIKLTRKMFLSFNVFNITTYNAIRYFVKMDSIVTGDPNGYRNTNKVIGSKGIEAEYNYKTSFGFAKIAYSFYTVAGKGVDSANEVSSNKDATLGTAQNKLTVLLSINAGKYCYVSPSLNFLGQRYGYSALDANGNGILTEYPAQTQLNLYLGSHRLIRNTDLGVGVNNITNEHILYLQAYNSLHGPLPGLGREFFIKFKYNFSFNRENRS